MQIVLDNLSFPVTTNARLDKTDFLDLVIKLDNGQVTTSVHNKTDYFPI